MRWRGYKGKSKEGGPHEMRPLQLQRLGILDGGGGGNSKSHGGLGSVLPLGGQAPSRRRVAPVTP